MKKYFLLSATGPDRPGMVSGVTKILFDNNCNLEDSSMMRLGSEFGIFLIFTSDKKISELALSKKFNSLQKSLNLNLGVKSVPQKYAHTPPAEKDPLLIRVFGADKPGIVYRVTSLLAKHKFNITDLETHRTDVKGKAGYILFIEGELKSKTKSFSRLTKDLGSLSKELRIKISLQPIINSAL